MTALTTAFLILGMAAFGAPLLLNLVSPLASAVITRTFPEAAWDAAMVLFAQGGAALATYIVGALVLELPWYAALIAALLVGVTSYARRAPEPFGSAGDIESHREPVAYVPHIDPDDARDGVWCSECGKHFVAGSALEQHLRAKHAHAE